MMSPSVSPMMRLSLGPPLNNSSTTARFWIYQLFDKFLFCNILNIILRVVIRRLWFIVLPDTAKARFRFRCLRQTPLSPCGANPSFCCQSWFFGRSTTHSFRTYLCLSPTPTGQHHRIPWSVIFSDRLRWLIVMLPSSVRRVVASSASQTGLASIASAATKTVASAPVVFRGHQRRCSSSKPSRSDNGSSDIAAGQSVPASANSTRGDGKAGSDKRKRKSKEATSRDASMKKLPSVPNTHHMSEEGKAHRPHYV